MQTTLAKPCKRDKSKADVPKDFWNSKNIDKTLKIPILQKTTNLKKAMIYLQRAIEVANNLTEDLKEKIKKSHA